MGDIADMMLEGLLDEETGEYIGDRNKFVYGTEVPGFPVSYERNARQAKEKYEAQKAQNIARNAAKQKTRCPFCNKKVKVTGLTMHVKDVHNREV